MDERQLGNVIHYNTEKGFGFLQDAEGVSRFFHITSVRLTADGGKPVPRIGDIFRFSLEESKVRPGSLQAADLELARRAQRPEAR